MFPGVVGDLTCKPFRASLTDLVFLNLERDHAPQDMTGKKPSLLLKYLLPNVNIYRACDVLVYLKV